MEAGAHPAVDSRLDQQGPNAGPVRVTQAGRGPGLGAFTGPGAPGASAVPCLPWRSEQRGGVGAEGDGLGPHSLPSSQAKLRPRAAIHVDPSQRGCHWQAGSRGPDLPRPTMGPALPLSTQSPSAHSGSLAQTAPPPRTAHRLVGKALGYL